LSKPSRTKAQVSRDKRGLKKLVDTGLYTGKTDYRRAPSPYQKRLMKAHADVIAGKAAVVRPKNPAAYKGIFKTRGDKVIVPKAKGEKIGLSKTGRITRQRPGRKPAVIIKAKRAPLPKPAPGKALVFAMPFKRGSGANATTQWKRFSHQGLVGFFERYRVDPKSLSRWLRYVEVEEVDADYERDLDRYDTGEDIDGPPPDALARTSSRYRSSKRKLRRDVLEGDEE
jgi:hypothetical protein